MRVIATYLLLALVALTTAQDIRQPPSLVEGPEDKLFKQGLTVTLKCVATGEPKPDYTWYKNGEFFNLNQPGVERPDSEVGTIHFDPASMLSEGMYQCRAQNQYGATLSNVVTVTMGTMGSYPDQPIVDYPAVEYQPLKLTCQGVKSVPDATFSWVTAASAIDNNPDPITPDKRINIDAEGNLHFAHVMQSDNRNDYLYKCLIFNAFLDQKKGGSYSRVQVTTASNNPVAPSIAYDIGQTIGFFGESVALHCIGAGFPTPTMTWRRIDGKALPIERHEYSDFNTKLTLTQLVFDDDTEYECVATSNAGVARRTVNLLVRQRPVYTANGEPTNKNATDGDSSVTFTCEVDALPAPEYKWLKNGDELTPQNMPSRMSINGGQLSIRDVCRNCPDGTSDLMVLQCNASNPFGYKFASAYLNILSRTKITTAPVGLQLDYFKDVYFNCSAISDDSTPITYRWFKDDWQIFPKEDRIEFLDNGKVLRLITEYDSDGGLSRVGNYTCEAGNGYSTDRATANLTRPIEEPPEPPATPGPVAGAGIGDLWWVFVIIAVILILLILCLCCCLCIQRNKGESYPVDEKERINGNDPEKEIADSGFQDYQRPEEGPLKGSRASLTSTIKMDSDEDASLAEYGDLDAGRFNEDGSFIGEYTRDKKKAGGASETNV